MKLSYRFVHTVTIQTDEPIDEQAAYQLVAAHMTEEKGPEEIKSEWFDLTSVTSAYVEQSINAVKNHNRREALREAQGGGVE